MSVTSTAQLNSDSQQTTSRSTVINMVMDQSRLLSPPALAMQVVNEASRPECTPKQLSNLLSQDPALCGKVLKAVNSCVFALSQPVSSLERAVMLLGRNPLRSLVLGLSLPVMQTTASNPRAFRDYWISSVSGAIFAREIAVHSKKKYPDDDMVAGLLRDIGLMLVQRAYTDAWANLQDQYKDQYLDHPCECEKKIFGIHHADVSAELLASWNLPEELVEPIRFHHHPDQYQTHKTVQLERAKLLNFIESLTRLDAIAERSDLLNQLLQTAKQEYDLPKATLIKLLQGVAPKVEAFAKLLNINVGQCPDFAKTLSRGCDELVKLTLETNLAASGVASIGQESVIPLTPPPRGSLMGSPYEDYPAVAASPMAATAAARPNTTPIPHATRTPSLPPIGSTLDGYHLEEVLGRGAMGIVYKAFEPSLNRYVAVKMLAPEIAAAPTSRQRFAREARTTAAIQQENVVSIYAVRETFGMPYIAMEYVRGQSLEARLEEKGPFRIAEVYSIAKQVALGLAAAHDKGIVHRDIKPANILMDFQSGLVKLTDFGLARGSDDLKLTVDGSLVGSPLYMSPEQIRGRSTDHRSDLFSFAGVIVTLLTGEPPFPGDTFEEVFDGVVKKEPMPIRKLCPDVPVWFEQVLQKLFQKKPANRYQKAQELLMDLAKYERLHSA